MTDRGAVDAGLEAVLRDERGRLTGALVRILGDWDLAEELVQDAAVAALEHWTTGGIPRNPGAWLMTTARRRAVDRLRRQARYRERMRPPAAVVERLAAAYRERGRIDRAIDLYRQALQINPKSEVSRRALTELGRDFSDLVR